MSDAFSVFDPVDELVEGFLERLRRGERPALIRIRRKAPRAGRANPHSLPALLVMEELGSRPGVSSGHSKIEPAAGKSARTTGRLPCCCAASGPAGWASFTRQSRNRWDGTWH